MILAPSRLQLLSGNKFHKHPDIVWITILISVFFNTAACTLHKKQPSKPPVVVEQPKKETPKKEEPKKETPKKEKGPIFSPEDSLARMYPEVKKAKYVIAVYLPLYLNVAEREKNNKTAITIAQEFYKGFLMAADTLKACGKDFDIHVFDSEDPKNTFWSVSNKWQELGVDLIYAPLLESKMTFLDSAAKRMKINLVSPLQVTEKCDTSRRFYLESIPSSETIGRNTAEYFKRAYPDYKYILINEKYTSDNPIAQGFAEAMKGVDSFHIVDFGDKGPSRYTPQYKLGEKNIVFVPSKYEVFVAGLMSQLRVGPQQPKDNPETPDVDESVTNEPLPTHEIIMAGLMNWEFFKTLEGDLWEKFKVHLACQYFIDYKNPNLNVFIENYRKRYNEEPSSWSFMGFDELVYYAGMLNKHGKYFQRGLYMANTPTLHSNYQLQYDTKCGGWRNNYVNLLKFEGYELRKVE
jgi:ABC-type branched-subunit amino acid transport system substrate-binding protein